MKLKQILSALIILFYQTTASAVVLAEVGSEKITLKEFNEEYAKVLKGTPINPPSKALFLDDMIRLELGVQEAKKRKLENDDIVQEQFRHILYRALLEREIGPKAGAISISSKELRNHYRKNPEIRTSHILIGLKPGASKKERQIARKRGQEIYAEVKKSRRPFEELVKLYTDDVQTKPHGGDLGWQTRLTLVPQYYKAAMRLKVGQITGVVETNYGLHILKLTGRKSFQKADKVKIRAQVFDMKRKRLFDAYFKSLKKKYKVKKNLKALLKK